MEKLIFNAVQLKNLSQQIQSNGSIWALLTANENLSSENPIRKVLAHQVSNHFRESSISIDPILGKVIAGSKLGELSEPERLKIVKVSRMQKGANSRSRRFKARSNLKRINKSHLFLRQGSNNNSLSQYQSRFQNTRSGRALALVGWRTQVV